jgi:6-phosphofructokinase
VPRIRTVRIGILCGGGPAPGINSVISAATIEAVNSGWEVVGILDGFEHLIEGATDRIVPLAITDVSRISGQGGTILYTSRANPTIRDDEAGDPEWRLHNCLRALDELGIEALVTIGGDDTAFSASTVAEAAGGRIGVAHVPKTIDNDLPLPAMKPTFGFETARHVGVDIVNNLMTDAMTTRRWYFVVAMGRTAGHLALGIGKGAGATLTVIPEEFPEGTSLGLKELTDILETSLLKRIAHGRPFGVAVLAEGLALRLPEDDLLRAAPEIERDEYGNIRLAEVHLHRLMTKLVKERFRARGERVTIEAKNIGYELRSAPPIPFDVEYTRDLGYGAVDYLRRRLAEGNHGPGAMITIEEGRFVPVPFDAFRDPATGRPRVRGVDVTSDSYRVATEYMIRLERGDLEDPAKLEPIAEAAGMSPEGFTGRFGYLVGMGEPPAA